MTNIEKVQFMVTNDIVGSYSSNAPDLNSGSKSSQIT
jgi:hypothetical protein